MRKTVLQRIKKNEKDAINIAQKYYSLLSAANDVHLTHREIQLVAFTAVKGNISYSSNKEEFCTLYNSSPPTINNMISKLKKLHLLVRDGGKTKVNPSILLDFENDIILQIRLIHG